VSHESPADTDAAAAMTDGEPARLEELWAGRFGDEYQELFAISTSSKRRLDKSSGWDDVAFWLFDRSRSLRVSSEA
jgi:hypothetical protein